MDNKFYQMNWKLTGKHNKAIRKHILEVLTGGKVLAKDAGITNLNNRLYELIKPEGDCARNREINFEDKAKHLIGQGV